jgi:hypothetical protein
MSKARHSKMLRIGLKVAFLKVLCSFTAFSLGQLKKGLLLMGLYSQILFFATYEWDQ